MRLLLCLLLLATAKATSVLYLEGDKISHALDDLSLTYVSFPESCEMNCRAEFVFQATADTTVHILQDAFYEQRLLVSAEGGEMQTTSELDLDVETLTLFKRTQSLSVPAGKVVAMTVVCTSLEGRFAVLVGETRDYSFWQLTLGFPVLVQSVRQWGQRFYFPIIFGILALLFFLSWPLQKRRPSTTMILSSLALLSLLAWAMESFYAYFLIATVTKKRSFFSFLLNVVVNLIFALGIGLTMEETLSTRRVAVLTILFCSLMIGGGGAYLCPVLLGLELLFLRERRGKMNSIVCKVV